MSDVTPLRRVSTVEALSDDLRSRILDLHLQPGEPLREVEEAGRYGVGRHSLRAALAELVHEGLLRREPHRGVYVPRVTADDVVDLFVVRAGLETEAVWRLVEGTIAVPDAAAAVERLEQLPHDPRWGEVVELDLQFHRAFFDALGSPRMSRIFASLQSELRLVLSQHAYDYGSVPEVAAQHRELLEALATGDPRVAANEVRRHLDDGLESILAAVRESPASSG